MTVTVDGAVTQLPQVANVNLPVGGYAFAVQGIDAAIIQAPQVLTAQIDNLFVRGSVTQDPQIPVVQMEIAPVGDGYNRTTEEEAILAVETQLETALSTNSISVPTVGQSRTFTDLGGGLNFLIGGTVLAACLNDAQAITAFMIMRTSVYDPLQVATTEYRGKCLYSSGGGTGPFDRWVLIWHGDPTDALPANQISGLRVSAAPPPSPARYPAVQPSSTGDTTFRGTCYSADGSIFVVCLSSTPYFAAYNTTVTPWAKLADPVALPPSNTRAIAFSPDGTRCALTTSGGITIYNTTTAPWTKIADPATAPAGTTGEINFNNDGTRCVVAHSSTPFFSAYNTTVVPWTKLANPVTLPTGGASAAVFSPDGTRCTIGHSTTPFFTVYNTTTSPWLKIANSAALPSGTVRSAAYHPSGNWLVMANGPGSVAWRYDTTTSPYTKLADPAWTNGDIGNFTADGNYLLLIPRIAPYPMQVVAWETLLPISWTYSRGGNIVGSISPNGATLTFMNPSAPFVTPYKFSDPDHWLVIEAGSVQSYDAEVRLTLSDTVTKYLHRDITATDGLQVKSAALAGTITTAALAGTGTGTDFATEFGAGTATAHLTDFDAQLGEVFSGKSVISSGSINTGVAATSSATALTTVNALGATAATFKRGGYAAEPLSYGVGLAFLPATGVSQPFACALSGSGNPDLPTGGDNPRILAVVTLNSVGAIASVSQPLLFSSPQVYPSAPQGRLTLSATNPLMPATIAATSTVYYLPSKAGGAVPITTDGATFTMETIGAGLSQLSTDATKSPAAVVPFGIYNFYVWDDHGVLRCTRGALVPRTTATATITIATPAVVSIAAHGRSPGDPVVFTTTGALPTNITAGTVYYVISAGLTAGSFRISATPPSSAGEGAAVNTAGTQSGVHTCAYCLTGDPSAELVNNLGLLVNLDDIANGPLAGLGTFVGTGLSDFASLFEFTYGGLGALGVQAFFGIDNYYNRAPLVTFVQDSTDSWNYTLAAWRPANGAPTMSVRKVFSVTGDADLRATYVIAAANSLAAFHYAGIGYDSSLAVAAGSITGMSRADATLQDTASFLVLPAAGVHTISAIEYAIASGTTTWRGDNGAPGLFQTGLLVQTSY